jgi:hypothetical protein
VFVAVLAGTVADASSLIDIGDRLIAEMMAAVPAPIEAIGAEPFVAWPRSLSPSQFRAIRIR